MIANLKCCVFEYYDLFMELSYILLVLNSNYIVISTKLG